jgi:hypothetical protein
MGVDPAKTWSITGELGSKFKIEVWGYPDIGVAICNCPSGGHDMIFLDYRACGPEGEPEVVHVDQESDYEITWLADDFESFVRGLVNEEKEEEEEDNGEAVVELTFADYVKVRKGSKRINVWFYNENPKPLAIVDKMYGINTNAYMNGYNWDALFNYYLTRHAPDVLEGMESDPEAGSYVAYYSSAPGNEARAEKFAQTIVKLVENGEELCRIVREEGEEIEWD